MPPCPPGKVRTRLNSARILAEMDIHCFPSQQPSHAVPVTNTGGSSGEHPQDFSPGNHQELQGENTFTSTTGAGCITHLAPVPQVPPSSDQSWQPLQRGHDAGISQASSTNMPYNLPDQTMSPPPVTFGAMDHQDEGRAIDFQIYHLAGSQLTAPVTVSSALPSFVPGQPSGSPMLEPFDHRSRIPEPSYVTVRRQQLRRFAVSMGTATDMDEPVFCTFDPDIVHSFINKSTSKTVRVTRPLGRRETITFPFDPPEEWPHGRKISVTHFAEVSLRTSKLQISKPIMVPMYILPFDYVEADMVVGKNVIQSPKHSLKLKIDEYIGSLSGMGPKPSLMVPVVNTTAIPPSPMINQQSAPSDIWTVGPAESHYSMGTTTVDGYGDSSQYPLTLPARPLTYTTGSRNTLEHYATTSGGACVPPPSLL